MDKKYDAASQSLQMQFVHSDHEDFMLMLEKLHEKDRWFQLAKQQLFIAKVKSEILAQTPKPFTKGLVALTISPEDSKLETCQEIIERLKKISAIEKMVWVYEQRTKDPTEEPKGWHIHASITTSYSPSHIKTYVAQVTFKKKRETIVCSVDSKRADANWENNYMRGNKFNPDKEPASKCDVIFRERLGLASHYVFER